MQGRGGNNEVIELKIHSNDYISDIRFLVGSKKFMVTSWDGSLGIYDYNERDHIFIEKVIHHEYPLLCCIEVIHNGTSRIYASSVQGELLQVDSSRNRFLKIDNIEQCMGISSLCTYRGKLICGSWDGVLLVIDCESNMVDFSIKLDGKKIYKMDSNDEKLIIYASNNTTLSFNLPLQRHNQGKQVESGLKFQTRDIKLLPLGAGYVSSSVDGRVAVEYFNEDTAKFAFRCHRMNLTDSQFVCPVNTICFLPNSNILYTGGSDGYISCWNLATRRKVEQLPKFNETSVVKIESNGDVLCVATSDDSFKTKSNIFENSDQQPSKLYLLYL